MDGASKRLEPPLRPIETGISAKTNVPESTLKQMLGCELRNGLVVGFHPRSIRDMSGSAQVDQRKLCLSNCIGDGIGLDSGNDAIALPLSQPSRRGAAALLLRNKDRPTSMTLFVGNHAA